LQVETATVVGTIEAAGAGNAEVIVTGALVTGSPLTVPVAVANNDTASQVATKIRAALNALAAITDNYTVGGADAEVTLTTIAVAANDATLNISIDNDTCLGLTAAPTSANTTAGHAGSGNATVVVTSALVTGSPITLNVAVLVDDTASAWAAKVRTALNSNSAITAIFDVGGTGASITLTNKVAAANDATLNISLADGTSNGITEAASSANTTAGHAGAGNAEVIITSALVTGSPLTVNVAVALGDTPALWAAKVRAHLATVAAITTYYAVGGTGTAISLTTLIGRANDATLNISLGDGTSNGITEAASSADTTAGVIGTGAHSVVVKGVCSDYVEREEIVLLQGVTDVLTVNEYFYPNELYIKTAGTGAANAGTITATTQTDDVVINQIEIGKNKAQQAIYMVPKDKSAKFSYFNVTAENATGGAITTIDLLVKKDSEVWIPEFSFPLDSSNPVFIDNAQLALPIFKPGTIIKIAATASAGSSNVKANFDIVYQ